MTEIYQFHAYADLKVVKLPFSPTMDQSTLIYGGLATIVVGLICVSTFKYITAPYSVVFHDEHPFILVLRAMGPPQWRRAMTRTTKPGSGYIYP